jgi:NAD(P)-dependent dehydrogenase (short-subunit alcohol dehydrogenase family)
VSGRLAGVARTVDTALDRSVVGGFSAIGSGIRRRLPTWPADPAPHALRGRHVAVTGATSGLGLATARQAAALGAHVHLVVRNEVKARPLVGEVEAAGAPGVDVWVCDVADPASVHAFVERFSASGIRLDGLVHNAGALPAERAESPDGHELTMAIHVLGPLRMTDGLLSSLADEARIVLVTSGGMYAQALPVDDPEYLRGDYSGATAYARSKRTQVELLWRLQGRWGERGIAVHAMHPGWASTPGVTSSLPAFAKVMGPVLRSPDDGADTTTWLLATQPPPPGGRLWHDRRARPTHFLPSTRATPAQVETMWQWVLDNA